MHSKGPRALPKYCRRFNQSQESQGSPGRRTCRYEETRQPTEDFHGRAQKLWREFAKIVPPGVATFADRWAVEIAVCAMAKFRAGTRERGSRFILLSTRARDSTVLRSDFVQAIQHFAARPQYYNTQPEDQKGGHFLISS